MKTTTYLALAGVTALALSTVSLNAATATFTGATDNQYLTGTNWDINSVPNTAGGDTALINSGAVVYTAGPDLTIGGGGKLQINGGSWTQGTGPAYIQLTGNGSVVVNGGTFNQGTATSNPFNVGGTGNVFTINSGAANFSTQVNATAGITYNIAGGATSMSSGPLIVQSGGNVLVSGGTLIVGGNLVLQDGSTWSQTGGTVTLGTGAELDFSSTSGSSMSGGTLNVERLLTGVNGPLGSTFNFSGGVINDGATGFSGFYGADNANHPFNFTLGSTGVINFLNGNTTVADVNGWLAAGGIQFNNTTNAAAFSVTQLGNTVSLSLLAVPEPSTYALLGVGLLSLFALRRKATVKA